MQTASVASTNDPFRILAVTQGLWGDRIAAFVAESAPPDWRVATWKAPRPLPPVIDDPDEFLPKDFPLSDLVLALGEVAGLAQLIPEIARRCAARSVLAPIDRNESLPAGLVRQLERWLLDQGISSVFPKPFCSLTESTVGVARHAKPYDDPLVRRFAARFGRPQFRVEVSEGRIARVDVLRDSACGCARHVALGLTGTAVDDALESAGMLHHHFPCLASMNQDADFLDTLMHVSGNLLKESLREEISDFLKPVTFLRPQGRSEPPQPSGVRHLEA
jgi:hypothetical protein